MKYFSICLLAVCMLAPCANAQFYLGAHVGQSDSEEGDPNDLSFFLYTNIDSSDQDVKDTSYSLIAGYEFDFGKNDYGIELAWIDFGENRLVAEGADFGSAGSGRRAATVIAEADAFTLAGVYRREIYSELSLYGKLGVSFWDFSGDLQGTVRSVMGVQTGSTSLTVSDDGADLFWGLGIEYYPVFLQIERYKFDEAKTDNIAIGVRYRLP